jgi:hypothetical protein
LDDLPVEHYFVDLTIGCARYQLEGTSERLGCARISNGFMAAPTARMVGTRQSVQAFIPMGSTSGELQTF